MIINRKNINIGEKIKKLSKYIFIFLLIMFALSLARNISKGRQIKTKVAEKEAGVNKLKTENEDLQKKIEEMKSPEYIEKQIRDNLGLSREGEIVVVLPDEDILRALAPKDTFEEETLPQPNWRQWLNLFI